MNIEQARFNMIEQHQGPIAPLLTEVLVQWWRDMYDSPGSGTFKLMIGEARNFPDIAEFYVREVIEPGHLLTRRIVERGIEAGEFRAVDVDNTVHSLLLPLVMVCTHKHAFGACTSHLIDAPAFIAAHVDLVVRGLLRTPPRIAAESSRPRR